MNPTFSCFLNQMLVLDLKIAEKVHQAGCPKCHSALHVANYPRKVRGFLQEQISKVPRFELSFSFCCSKDGCRRRVTPYSLRFLKGKVYLFIVIVLVGAQRASFLGQEPLMSNQTKRRWQKHWSSLFHPLSVFCLKIKAHLPPRLGLELSLRSLFGVFTEDKDQDEPQGMIRCLEFLSSNMAQVLPN